MINLKSHVLKRTLLIFLSVWLIHFLFSNASIKMHYAKGQSDNFIPPDNSLVYDIRLDEIRMVNKTDNLALAGIGNAIGFDSSADENPPLLEISIKGKSSIYLVKTEEEVLSNANVSFEIPSFGMQEVLTEFSSGCYGWNLSENLVIKSKEPLQDIDPEVDNWLLQPLDIIINHQKISQFSFTDYLVNVEHEGLSATTFEVPVEIEIKARLSTKDTNEPVSNKTVTLTLELPTRGYSEDITLTTDERGIIRYKRQEKGYINVSGGNLLALEKPIAIPGPKCYTTIIDEKGNTAIVRVPVVGLTSFQPVRLAPWWPWWPSNRPKPKEQNPPIEGPKQGGAEGREQVGDPINIVSGNVYGTWQDLFIPSKGMPLEFTRSYNSREETVPTPFSRGWTHNFNMSIFKWNVTKTVFIDEDGTWIFFTVYGDEYIPPKGVYLTLTKNADDSYTLKDKHKKVYEFDSGGKLTAIKDRNQNQITLTYRSNGKLETITDTVGRQINIYYNSSGRIEKVTDPKDNSIESIEYIYDPNGNLATVKDQEENETHYSYNEFNYLIGITEPNENKRGFTYNDDGFAEAFSYVNYNNNIVVTYDPDNKTNYVTDSKGYQTIYRYDEFSGSKQIIEIEDPLGNIESYTWNDDLNKTSITDKNGNPTTFTYDSMGNLLTTTDPRNTTEFTYHPEFNLLTSITSTLTDKFGNVIETYTTTYDYDPENGDLLTITDPKKNKTQFTYYPDGQLHTSTNARGYPTTFTYDPNGNLETSSDPLVNVTRYTYDEVGNCTEIKDANGNKTTFTYDKVNRLIKITYPDDTPDDSSDNPYTEFEYDPSGNRTKVIDPLKNTTQYRYDYVNRLKEVEDHLENITSYTYDTESNLTKVIDAEGNETTYTYNILNRLTNVTNAKEIETIYKYDAVGNRILMTDGNGNTINYTYGELNRLTKITYPVNSVEFSYDNLGRRETMIDSHGTTDYTYDELSRLIKVDGPFENDVIEYEYNEVGNRTKMIDQNGGITTYIYDEANRLKEITDPQRKTTTYEEYDDVGNLTKVSYPNNTTINYIFDTLNRLTSLTNKNPQGEAISKFDYTYDDAGRRTDVVTKDATIHYDYDEASRLTGETRLLDHPYNITYEYDKVGNRKKLTKDGAETAYTYNELNQLIAQDRADISPSTNVIVQGTTDDNTATIKVNDKDATVSEGGFTTEDTFLTSGLNLITAQAQDGAGNISYHQIQVTVLSPQGVNYFYDKNGNLIKKVTQDKTTTYSYDYENRLTAVKGLSPRGTVPEVIAEYTYDGEGKRISATENGTTTHYLYDGLLPIIERSPTGQTLATYTRGLSLGGGIGGIISSLRGSGATEATSYYHYNALGNVVNLTDSAGAVTNSYAYSAFGETVSQTGTIPNPYQFSTKPFSPTTGLIYFGFRYYDPSVGRFITPDPLGMINGPNLYTYVTNNPINYIDPYGLSQKGPRDDSPNPRPPDPKPKPPQPKPGLRPIVIHGRLFYYDPSDPNRLYLPEIPDPQGKALREVTGETLLSMYGLGLGIGAIALEAPILGAGASIVAGISTVRDIARARRGEKGKTDVVLSASGMLPGRAGVIGSAIKILRDIFR